MILLGKFSKILLDSSRVQPIEKWGKTWAWLLKILSVLWQEVSKMVTAKLTLARTQTISFKRTHAIHKLAN